jgi:hypothetical protein
MVSQRRVAQVGLAAAALVLFLSVGILMVAGNSGLGGDKSGGMSAGQNDPIPLGVTLSARAHSNDPSQP